MNNFSIDLDLLFFFVLLCFVLFLFFGSFTNCKIGGKTLTFLCHVIRNTYPMKIGGKNRIRFLDVIEETSKTNLDPDIILLSVTQFLHRYIVIS